MVADTLKKDGTKSLLRAIDADLKELEFQRDTFAENVRILVGTWYAQDGAKNKVPINKFAQAVNTLVPLLFGKNPSVNVTTKHDDLRSVALAFQYALPERFEQIRYAKTARKTGVTSLFAPMGITHVGRRYQGEVEFQGLPHQVTSPFVRECLLEDFVFDTQAREWEEVQYAGHRVWLDYEQFMDEADIDPKTRDSLTPEDRHDMRDDMVSGEKVSAITRSHDGRRGQYRDTIPVWYVWCPSDNSIKLVNDLKLGEVISEREYVGPDYGPYHMLSYTDVPGQILSLSPAMLWRDLAEIINMIWNKSARQVARQKTATGFRDAGVVERIQETPDGGSFYDPNPTDAQERNFGGVFQPNIAFLATAEQMFEDVSGNISLLGGLGNQSPTASQDAMLSNSAGERIRDMSTRVHNWHKEVIEHIGMDVWEDATFDPELRYSPPGSGVEFTLDFSPEKRYGDFFKFNFDIEPFSMSIMSPQQKQMVIDQHVMQVLMPAQQMMAQQGAFLNWEEYERQWARSMGVENEMRNFLKFGPADVGGGSDERRSPPVTTRENIRTSQSQSGKPSNMQMLSQAMQAASARQPSQSGQGSY